MYNKEVPFAKTAYELQRTSDQRDDRRNNAYPCSARSRFHYIVITILTAVSEKLLFQSSCQNGFYRSHMTNRLAVNAVSNFRRYTFH